MASVEDLIATMNSGVHVGKQGYDLTALQAQLAKTLAYNPHAAVNHTFAPYQPISGSANIPPAPVSSLNSVASTSFTANGYTQQRPSGRPMPTPQVSYSGFDAPMYSASPRNASGSSSGFGRRANGMSIDEEGDMEMEEDEGAPRASDSGNGGWVATGFQPLQFQQELQSPEQYANSYDMSTSVDLAMMNGMSPRSRSRPRAAAMSFAEDGPAVASDHDDFSAFASDAFAPVVQDTYSSSADSLRAGQSNGSIEGNDGRNGVGGDGYGGEEATECARDGWEAFRRHAKVGATSAFAITPTNRTAPGSPTIDPMTGVAEPPLPWSGRLRSHRPSGSGSD